MISIESIISQQIAWFVLQTLIHWIAIHSVENVINTGLSGLGSSPSQNHCVVFLGKTFTHTVSPSTKVCVPVYMAISK